MSLDGILNFGVLIAWNLEKNGIRLAIGYDFTFTVNVVSSVFTMADNICKL